MCVSRWPEVQTPEAAFRTLQRTRQSLWDCWRTLVVSASRNQISSSWVEFLWVSHGGDAKALFWACKDYISLTVVQSIGWDFFWGLQEVSEYLLGFHTAHLSPCTGEISTMLTESYYIWHTVPIKAPMECSLMRDFTLIHHHVGFTSSFPHHHSSACCSQRAWSVTCLIFRVSPSISSLYLKLLSIHLPLEIDMSAVNPFDWLPTFVIRLLNMPGFIVLSEQIIKTVPDCCLMSYKCRFTHLWM